MNMICSSAFCIGDEFTVLTSLTAGDGFSEGQDFSQSIVGDEFTAERVEAEAGATELQEYPEIQQDSYLQKIRQEVVDTIDKKLDVADMAKKNS